MNHNKTHKNLPLKLSKTSAEYDPSHQLSQNWGGGRLVNLELVYFPKLDF